MSRRRRTAAIWRTSSPAGPWRAAAIRCVARVATAIPSNAVCKTKNNAKKMRHWFDRFRNSSAALDIHGLWFDFLFECFMELSKIHRKNCNLALIFKVFWTVKIKSLETDPKSNQLPHFNVF